MSWLASCDVCLKTNEKLKLPEWVTRNLVVFFWRLELDERVVKPIKLIISIVFKILSSPWLMSERVDFILERADKLIDLELHVYEYYDKTYSYWEIKALLEGKLASALQIIEYNKLTPDIQKYRMWLYSDRLTPNQVVEMLLILDEFLGIKHDEISLLENEKPVNL